MCQHRREWDKTARCVSANEYCYTRSKFKKPHNASCKCPCIYFIPANCCVCLASDAISDEPYPQSFKYIILIFPCKCDSLLWFMLLITDPTMGLCPTENGTHCELSQMLWQMTLHWKVFVTNYVSIKKQSISQCANSLPSKGSAIDRMLSMVHLTSFNWGGTMCSHWTLDSSASGLEANFHSRLLTTVF